MRAVVLSGNGEAKVEQRPRPRVSADDEAIVMVTTAGLTHTDLARYGGAGRGALGVIPGGEFAGNIVEAGDSVRAFQLNDLVFCVSGWRGTDGSWQVFGCDVDGGHADYVSVPHADSVLVRTSAAAEERALLAGGTLGLGSSAAEMAGKSAQGRYSLAVVVGCDPLGVAALACLKATGAFSEVMAVDSHPARLVLARRYGATTCDSRTSGPEKQPVKAAVVVAGGLADGPGYEWAAGLVAADGAVVFVEPDGAVRWTESGFARLEVREIVCAEWPSRELAAKLAVQIKVKKPDLTSFVSHVVQLDDAGEAYRQASRVTPGTLKVLLKP